VWFLSDSLLVEKVIGITKKVGWASFCLCMAILLFSGLTAKKLEAKRQSQGQIELSVWSQRPSTYGIVTKIKLRASKNFIDGKLETND